ncbi:hypothetical protein BP6252_01682 [Coleophoma cylindrospora]|uniref:Epoxide hydrolase N-terminal domain-containing protein n=1 Tax=Coleophoma cylindrospora TaxID=1849047 RepID=A0A3D8STK4_9HELO|nr:hypothetical protein BP6252_01682 [Coleophoma cylindrospora]
MSGNKKAESTPKPFKVHIDQSRLDHLQQKLSLTDFPGELEDAGNKCGPRLADIKRLTSYWKDSFDWRGQEEKMNKLPMFTIDIEVSDGFGVVNVHFVHQRAAVENAVPLLFVHGWPGNFLEVSKMLPSLKTGNEDGNPAFHVVAPSLVNFGFSSRVNKEKFGIEKHAEVYNKLMIALGYDQYVAQGGDWGSLILRGLGLNHSAHVKALHTNMAVANFPSPFKTPVRFVTSLAKHALSGFLPTYTPAESAMLARITDWKDGSGKGYFAQMSTKPQTIGYSLADSPVGLLAWIYEKLVLWTDEYPWTDDEILTWVSIYYFSTAGPDAASFLYYESQNEKVDFFAWVDIPIGLAYLPKEVCNLPLAWAQGLGRIVHVTEADKGGHFAAYERPDVIVGDLQAMMRKGGPAFGVVESMSGYAR